MTEIDSLDELILKELSLDSRQSLRQLAKKLGVAITTAGNRVEKLKSNGIIKSFTVEIDYEKLGYNLTAVIDATIAPGKALELEGALAKAENAFAVYDVTGNVDSVIIAKFKGRKELSKFIEGSLSMENIERTNTRIVLNTIKEKMCGLP